MPPTVECCVRNIDEDTRGLLAAADCEAVESFCLDRCGTCYARDFLVVDGEPVAGESHRAALEAAGVSE